MKIAVSSIIVFLLLFSPCVLNAAYKHNVMIPEVKERFEKRVLENWNFEFEVKKNRKEKTNLFIKRLRKLHEEAIEQI